MEKAVISIIVICFALIIIVCVLYYMEIKDCHNKGGKMVGTGEYTTTATVVGNQAIISTNENRVCDKE
ncbi:hypothetical protein COI63_11460 [Bacillus toyonensis]|nr:hypothetical protein CN688_05540 [Bacillus toyonensis]PEK75629.1 hypothetical protein CN594_30115 [Bacillus toyonensis]PEL24713.1 hypothetical protein CN624_17860 [Bacillus toyonensis]PEO51543.1 hypothetical protein CN579_27635 [Bacillus toyonensis]PFY35453.1 hypothetical protein COL54_29230 [Bacillus toyonensis]